MPVIRGSATVSVIPAKRRQELLGQLTKELSGSSTPGGPVIFEIPLDQSDKIDVLAVWDAWASVRSEDRTSIILEAYDKQQEKIAQALGVSYNEAIEQQLLPYRIIPRSRGVKVDTSAQKKAMLAEGGFELEGGRIDLRLPTVALAETAQERLCEKLPKVSWSIIQTATPIP